MGGGVQVLTVSVGLFVLLQLITGATSDPQKNEDQSVSKEPPKDGSVEIHKKQISMDEPPPLPENPTFLAQLQPLIDQLKEAKPAIWGKIQQTVSNVWNRFGWGKNTNPTPPATPSQPVGLGQVGSLSSEAPQKNVVGKVKRTGPGGPNNQNISPVDQSQAPVDHKVTPADHKVIPIDQSPAPVDHKVIPIDQSPAPVDHKVIPISPANLDEQSAQAQSQSPNPTVVEEKPEELAVGPHKQPESVAAVPSSKGEVAPPGKREEQTHRQEEAPQQQHPAPAPAPAVDSQVARPVQPSQPQPPVAATMPPFKLDVNWSRRLHEERLIKSGASSSTAPTSGGDTANELQYTPTYKYDPYEDIKHAEDYGQFLLRLLNER